VHGELLTFDDPVIRLSAIDRLEGFHPGGPCLYRRVLVPVQVSEAGLPAWLYVCVGGGSLDRELQSANWRNLAMNPQLLLNS